MLNSPLVLVARTDAEAATMIDSNIAARRGTGLPGQGGHKMGKPPEIFLGNQRFLTLSKHVKGCHFGIFGIFLSFYITTTSMLGIYPSF